MKLICFFLLFTVQVSFAQINGKYLSVETGLQNPNDVVELQLSELTGKISTKIEEFKNLKTVRLINLRSDFDLDDAFQKLGKYTSVKNLYLYGNQHTKLPQSLSQIKSLEFIELNSNLTNDLESIISQLSKIPNFNSLSLKSMHLSKLPNSITELKNLKSLNLGSNPDLDLDKAFELLETLQITTLDISEARFNVVPASISRLKYLKRLEMELIEGKFNNKQSFTNLAKLKYLEELNIQGNFFGKLDRSVQQLAYLKLIEIDGNCIVEGNLEALQKLLPTTKIHNEIPC